MKQRLESPQDWAELCTFIGGEAETLEMTPLQYQIVASLLGLCREEPYPDEYLSQQVLPALVKSMQELGRAEA